MKVILRLILVLAIVALFMAGRAWYYSDTKYEAPAKTPIQLSDISVPVAPAGSFVEGYETKKGVILLDRSHRNNFVQGELDVLLARLTSRGYAIETLARATDLKEKLRYADAAIIIAPRTVFPDADAKLLEGFVNKGGKLLLIGKPTRASQINTVASRFGLMFEPDYLYNLKENDGNFKNIFISDFRDSEITRNLKKIALYTAGSITSLDSSIALADANTYSSVKETKGRLSPVAQAADSRVLAIAELTFLTEPYNSILDNNQLVINISEWLMRSQRTFDLTDFPYFFKNKADVAYTDAKLLDKAVAVKNLLAEQGKTSEVAEYQKGMWQDRNIVLLGFLRDVSKLEDFLKAADITVTVTPVEKEKPESETATPEAKPEPTPTPSPTPTPKPTPSAKSKTKETDQEPEEKPVKIKVEIKNMGQVYQKDGTAIFYLNQDKGRYVLIVLSDTEAILKQGVDLLQSGKFRQWLVSDKMVIYHTPKEDAKEQPPSKATRN